MTNPFTKKVIITITLIFLTVSSFLIRLENFQKPNPRTIDEILYYRLATQLSKDITNYNIIDYGWFLLQVKARTELPDYFKKPLFKHPPLFPVLISKSFKMFGEHPVAASYVSVTFGVLMIPLIYLLGTLLFNARVGLLSAYILYIDPISIISSQKVWMDSSLAFFMVLAVYFFTLGLKKGWNLFFIFSGIASGCAFLTKYPGILTTLSIVLYVAVYQRELFQKKTFRIGIIMPFLMILPWVYWNFRVYGLNFIAEHAEIHDLILERLHGQSIIAFLVGLTLISLISMLNTALEPKKLKGLSNEMHNNKAKNIIRIACGALILLAIKDRLILALQFMHLPIFSWNSGDILQNENLSFYFGRLTEFSLVYFVAFISFFINLREDRESVDFLRIIIVVPFIFFTIWSNYQSRYILPVIPFLIILCTNFWLQLFYKAAKQKNNFLKYGLYLALLCAGIFVVGRTNYINEAFTFTNKGCYF